MIRAVTVALFPALLVESRATAIEFGSAGAKVVVAGRRNKEGQETVELIEEVGGQATCVRTDVSREADVAALMDAAVETYGRLDCAVNNAGREAIVGVVDASEEDFDAEVAVNAKGVFFCLRHEIRHMRQNGGGAIVNTTSVSGLRPTHAQAVYGMSKAAVTYLTRTAAAEVGKQRIRVNEIAPALRAGRRFHYLLYLQSVTATGRDGGGRRCCSSTEQTFRAAPGATSSSCGHGDPGDGSRAGRARCGRRCRRCSVT